MESPLETSHLGFISCPNCGNQMKSSTQISSKCHYECEPRDQKIKFLSVLFMYNIICLILILLVLPQPKMYSVPFVNPWILFYFLAYSFEIITQLSLSVIIVNTIRLIKYKYSLTNKIILIISILIGLGLLIFRYTRGYMPTH